MPLTLIASGGTPSHDMAGKMAEKIKDVIYEYDGMVTLALALGVLEIVKSEIISDHAGIE